MSLKASLLLDGQLAAGETAHALRETIADPQLRDRFTVYRLVGDTLRGNSTPDDGYSKRIFERMVREHSRIEAAYDPLAADD